MAYGQSSTNGFGRMPLPVQNAVLAGAGSSLRPRRRPSALRALAADENHRSFLRVVSHELRTPLNAIIGFSEIISRELYGPINEPRYREHAELVRDSGMRLLKLVNDVLEIARLEAGAADLALRPENPLAAAEEAIRALETEAEKRQVCVRIIALPQTPRVNTIFLHLLQNAIAYSPQGASVEITIAADGETVVLEVRDHGDGVAPEDLARILKPFEQAENALVRRSDGAGLGLAIVGLLCTAMDGRLVLRSVKGEGLSATVRLPAARPLEALPVDL
jgi:signal transduction histidine kinase